ncbi:ArnT family glycosyltransferase [Levilinea saccharolytica]|uniref:Glycosyltransferase RgtA/B/C/D-like domain-containing protein n=1 Tax=Levilinea saccharolytica TaxID=229921 RepID=A0A0P6XYR5_9CHLR|nr:glycosyltransferase family 39 protein [Levilinea saccharolytica]KPL89956.1 hypothetical protein ADN01_03550 [Levilinea saccharolytica]GAP16346.1 4-amino-4-deoxy-L-arabinose transferase [Levilinea saccharolytica]
MPNPKRRSSLLPWLRSPAVPLAEEAARPPEPPAADTAEEVRALRAEVAALRAERDALRAQLQALQPQPPPDEPGPRPTPPWAAWARRHARALAVGLGLILSLVVPVWLILRERWLQEQIRDMLYREWNAVPFFKTLALPSYFLIVFACLLAALFIFLRWVPRDREGYLPDPSPIAEPLPTLSPLEGWICRGLQIAAVLLAMFSFGRAALSQTYPGAELLLALLLYLLGRLLTEFPWVRLRAALGRMPAWPWLFALVIVALTLFLRALTWSQSAAAWGLGAFLALALAALWPQRARVPAAAWLVLLALVLYSLQILSWQFAAIGDEHSFYTYARDQLEEFTFSTHVSRFFSGQAVYGSHPYFSSLIQAAFMGILGKDAFGWRFSNIFLISIAAALFYAFFRRFTHPRTAFLTAFWMACSHYLMAFSKIGYNNLQALFLMGVVLALTAEAAHTRRRMAYSLLGTALGFCFYVYPAALYVLPLPVVFLLFYDFPRDRQAWGRWWLMLTPLFLLLAPLVFQPGYWAEKIPGTFLNKPELTTNGGSLGQHFLSNLLYSALGYLYIPNESHFVVSSYMDPLSGILVTLGFFELLRQAGRQRFARAGLACFALLLILVGTTHDREFPANTRMFMLLPFWAWMAASALDGWMRRWANAWPGKPGLQRAVLGAVLLGVAALNLYQGYGLSRLRTVGIPEIEVLFVRLLQRDHALFADANKTYLFLTEEDWGIDGIRVLRDIYRLPPSQEQLDRAVVTEPKFSPELAARIRQPDVLVIFEPWMNEDLVVALEGEMVRLGKYECPVQDAVWTPPRFDLWTSREWVALCPRDGDWTARP